MLHLKIDLKILYKKGKNFRPVVFRNKTRLLLRKTNEEEILTGIRRKRRNQKKYANKKTRMGNEIYRRIGNIQ